jgi:DNA-binding transcriptional LysR family regulator
MNTQHLAIFHQVVRQASFSKVADGHQMSPSSISRMIKQLEDELGFELFLRTTRQIHLTKAGEHFYQHTLDILKQLDLAKEAALDEQNALSGRLSITLPVDFADAVILPLMGEFHQQNPHIQLDILTTNRLVDLRKEQIDIGIRLGQIEDDQLIAKPLIDMQFGIFAHPSYLEQQPLLDVQTLAQAQWIHYLPTHTLLLRHSGEQHTIQIAPAHRVSGAFSAKNLAEGGLGLVLLPDWMMRVPSSTLVPILADWEVQPASREQSHKSWIVYPGHTRLTQKASAWRDFILRKLNPK